MASWMLRAKPHKTPRATEFLQRSMVAVGWPYIGNIASLDEAGIRTTLTEHYPTKPAAWIGSSVRDLLLFRDSMAEGDLILAARDLNDRKGMPLFGIISGPYQYDDSVSGGEEGCPHQRPVRWLRPGIARSYLPKSITSLLGRRGSTILLLPDGELDGIAREHGWLD